MYKSIDKKEFVKYYIENRNSFIDETNRYFLLDLSDLVDNKIRPIFDFTYQEYMSCDKIIISNNPKFRANMFKQITICDFFKEMCKQEFDIKNFVAINIETDEFVYPETISIGEDEDEIIILEVQKHDEIQF
jgi:hypothetical protein